MEIDYKEKYMQAMERARQFREKPYLEDSAGIVKYIFPELAESEDERIRKTLKEYFINSFQNNGVAAICGVHIKDILAWLEKQGDKDKFIKKELGCIKGYREKAIKRLEELEKQGEQKLPIEKLPFEMKTPEESLGIDSDTYSKIVDECIYGEQKPAWSEEELYKIENALFGTYAVDVATRLLNKIKSLKERYTWKPSDEQMNALNYVLNLMASSERPIDNDLRYNILKSLRQQLKKLKEE